MTPNFPKDWKPKRRIFQALDGAKRVTRILTENFPSLEKNNAIFSRPWKGVIG
jgi:hypothetical protein